MAGIHLHPHDILDEGVDSILERITKMNGVDRLFVEVNTIFERNPYPTAACRTIRNMNLCKAPPRCMSNSICPHCG